MRELINEMFEKKRWAVVGATPNKEKFGNKLFNKLLSRGYDVYPVNPTYDEVEGHKAYKDVLSLPEVDCIDVVVPKKLAMGIIDMAVEKNIKNVWFQPHTYDDEIIAYAKSKGLNVVYDHCVLVELG